MEVRGLGEEGSKPEMPRMGTGTGKELGEETDTTHSDGQKMYHICTKRFLGLGCSQAQT